MLTSVFVIDLWTVPSYKKNLHLQMIWLALVRATWNWFLIESNFALPETTVILFTCNFFWVEPLRNQRKFENFWAFFWVKNFI
jgi:hypothetical protein